MSDATIIRLSDYQPGGAGDFQRVAIKLLEEARKTLPSDCSIADRQIAEIGRRIGRAADDWLNSEMNMVPVTIPTRLTERCGEETAHELVHIGAMAFRSRFIALVTIERVLAEVEALCGSETRAHLARMLPKV